jgi:hypothetical protein
MSRRQMSFARCWITCSNLWEISVAQSSGLKGTGRRVELKAVLRFPYRAFSHFVQQGCRLVRTNPKCIRISSRLRPMRHRKRRNPNPHSGRHNWLALSLAACNAGEMMTLLQSRKENFNYVRQAKGSITITMYNPEPISSSWLGLNCSTGVS